jgi:hypothetical protein
VFGSTCCMWLGVVAKGVLAGTENVAIRESTCSLCVCERQFCRQAMSASHAGMDNVRSASRSCLYHGVDNSRQTRRDIATPLHAIALYYPSRHLSNPSMKHQISSHDH